MREWLGNIAVILCVMTVILHLIPEGNFTKYVRFYISLLYLLVVSGPLLRLFSQDDVMERFFTLELLREEHYDLETSVKGLQELKNKSFRSAWETELARQLGEIVAAYGGSTENIQIRLGDDDTLQEVSIAIRTEKRAEGMTEQIREEISEIFSLDPERILIVCPGGG